jgi:hypothetical protein
MMEWSENWELKTPLGEFQIDFVNSLWSYYLNGSYIGVGDDIQECKYLCKCYLENKIEELKEFLYGNEMD